VKRLLLVAYYFPPLVVAGTFRALRLARYLPRAGWNVTVVSGKPTLRLLKDAGLEREIPPEVQVLRATSIEPRNALLALHQIGLGSVARRVEPWFMLPDDQRGWAPFALAAARRAHAAAPFDAVITTSAPYSAHLVGRALRRAGLPWLADFRDEWTTNPYLSGRYPTGWHLRESQRLERAVLEEADRVVSVSEPCLAGLRRAAPGQPDGKFRVLPNGYDAAHFPAHDARRPERFRIVFTGTFYGHHTPRVFLEGLTRACADGRVRADDVEVVFAGHTAGLERIGAALPLPVRVVEHLPHGEAVALMRDAAVLLLVLSDAGGPGIYTTKLFEYLAARRPILALVPVAGVAADLVRKSRSGTVVAPDDPRAVADALARLYSAWQEGGIPHDPDLSVIERFEGSRQAADWAALLDEMCTESRG